MLSTPKTPWVYSTSDYREIVKNTDAELIQVVQIYFVVYNW